MREALILTRWAKALIIDIPLVPHTASRPNWTAKGDLTITHMPKGYREWRLQFASWFNQYLEATNDELLVYLSHLQDGRPIVSTWTTTNRKGEKVKHHKLISDFYGYFVKAIFVLPRPANNLRPYPFETKTADLDNYYKAVIDGVFESEGAKAVKLNDRWIQEAQIQKRYTLPDGKEQPHIELEIKRIERGGQYT